MVSAIHTAPPVPPPNAVKASPRQGPTAVTSSATATEAHPIVHGGTDTVQISNAALAAMQETIETPAQTAKKANAGDHQAQRLLSREAA
ncbi:MAG: hypothetical protein WBM04_10620, partial [Candidatus Korobacteraceae bacterium]